MAPVHCAAGSDAETNFGVTSLAAPKAVSSRVCPHRGENRGPGKDDRGELDIRSRNWRTKSAQACCGTLSLRQGRPEHCLIREAFGRRGSKFLLVVHCSESARFL